MNSELQKIENKKFKRIILIIACSFILCLGIFAYFFVSTQSRMILREAKNVQIAFQMLSIEYYSKGESIYDFRKRNGMADGVKERVDEILGEVGEIMITRYEANNREVTGFIYERNNFRVIYVKTDAEKVTYKVQYVVPVLYYEN